MRRLIEICLENRVAANLFAAIIIIAGLISVNVLNVRLFPQLVLNAIAVTVPYPGATPTEVETSILKPIEERLEGLEGVRKITGLAASNLASVIIDLEEGVSIPEMLDDIQTEVDRITVFPIESERPQITHAEAEELAAQIIIYGDRDTRLLKTIAERVRTDLSDLPGVSRATIQGVPDYLIDISISQATLQSLGVSLVDVARRVSQQSLDLSGGEIENSRQKLLVRATGERRSGEEFKTVVLGAGVTGTPVLLGDVANIEDGLAETPEKAIYKGKPAAFVSVYRVGDEKLLDLTEEVRAYFSSDIKAALPDGVEAVLWRDESVNLQQRIELLSENAFVGLLLVCILLMAFLDIRIAGWVAFGVSVAFVGAFTFMVPVGVTINQLTLFGFILAIGIVVDDAIVVGENIHATWRKTGTPKEAARLGVLRVSTPVLFSVSTTIVAFVPLLFIPGTFGQFLGPIAVVVIIVLALSLFESFFVLPRHLSHLRSEAPRWWSPRRFADPFRDWVSLRLKRFTEGPLRRVITFTTTNPLMVILTAFGIFAGSLTLISSGVVKFIFFPEVEGDYVTTELELSEAASQDLTFRYADYIAKAAARAAEKVAPGEDVLEGIFSTLGVSQALETGQANTSSGAAANKAFVVARLQEASTRGFSAGEFEEAWRAEIGEIPGAQKLTITSDLVTAGAPVQLEISTRNSEDTAAAVAAIRRELEALPGVFDVRDDRFRTTDEVKIELKPLAVSYGLTQNDLAQNIRAAFFGAEAARIQRDREEVEVRVRFPEADRGTLEAMKQMRIRVGDGFISIESLANLSIAPAPATITRIGSRRVFTLTSDVDTKISTAGVVTDYIFDTVLPREAQNFDGLTITLSGDQEEQAQVGPAITRNFLLAMMVIYTLLALSFRSYTQPLIVMMAIPFGFMGALLGHALMGLDMTLLSMFGVIGLAGVIINNALMVITFVNDRLAAGERRVSAVIEAMLERFRAILLTTLTTFLGVIPIILETSVQAQFLVPTAVSLGFGIIIGTAILIFIMPAFAIAHLKIFGHQDMTIAAQSSLEAVDIQEAAE